MSNFNDKIKALLAFSASFEEFKSELAKSMDELNNELKTAKLDAFDSAKRTFYEESEVLKSFVDKGFNELRKELETLKDSKELDFLASALSDLDKQLEGVRDSIVKPKSYDAEIKALKALIKKMPAPKSYDKEIKALSDKLNALPKPKSYDKELAKIESGMSVFVNAEQVKKLLAELPKPKDFSGDIARVESKLKAIKLPTDKSLEIESLLSRVRKLEAVKPVDYSQEIAAVKNSMPAQIDNSEQIQDLSSQLESALSKVNVKLSELNNLEKQVKNNAIIADSARRTFGEEIGVLKSYIDKEFSKLKGENNG